MFLACNFNKKWLFGENIGVWPPGVIITGVTLWGLLDFLLSFQSFFNNNLALEWLFMVKLLKMVKNCPNIVKTLKFHVFHHFRTPWGVLRKPEKCSNTFFITIHTWANRTRHRIVIFYQFDDSSMQLLEKMTFFVK